MTALDTVIIIYPLYLPFQCFSVNHDNACNFTDFEANSNFVSRDDGHCFELSENYYSTVLKSAPFYVI